MLFFKKSSDAPIILIYLWLKIWINLNGTCNRYDAQRHYKSKYTVDKKVLLRERKRHTARRVAIAISCYSMYQAKSGVKIFSLYWGGGGGAPRQKFFFPVWTCIKPNMVSKIFPFTGGGGGGVSLNKNFLPVWTCIKPNLVSKIFPFTETGYCPPPWKSETWAPPQKSETWDPPPKNLRPGTPPPKIWDLGPSPPRLDRVPPPPKVNRQTFPSINITFPRTTYAGGKNGKYDNWLKVRFMMSDVRLKFFKVCKKIHTFCINKQSKIFSSKTFPVLQ